MASAASATRAGIQPGWPTASLALADSTLRQSGRRARLLLVAPKIRPLGGRLMLYSTHVALRARRQRDSRIAAFASLPAVGR